MSWVTLVNNSPCTEGPRIAIVQRLIPHYRVDFFTRLFERLPNAMVYHSTQITPDSLVEKIEFPFAHCSVEMTDHRFFCYQYLFLSVLRGDYDYLVLGLELRIVSNLLLWFAAFFRRTRIVWWTHGYNVHNRKRNFMFYLDRIIKTFLMKRSHRILLYTKYNLPELRVNGVPDEKIIILNNTINEVPHLESLRNVSDEDIATIERSTRKSQHTIMSIGRLTPMKKLDDLICAIPRLVVEYPDLRVFIIGDGIERLKLEERSERLGLQENVFFLGAINDPKALAPYMKLTDLIVIPGATGLSLVHGMICGVPYVTLQDAPHGPEIAYLNNDYNGYAATDLDDMVQWLRGCFERPENIVTMKKNCRALIKNEINMDGMVSRFASAFQ